MYVSVRVAILCSMVAVIIAPGCMRFSSEEEINYMLRAGISETGSGDKQVETSIEYKNWGAGAGQDKTYGTSDDDVESYLRLISDKNGRVQSLQRGIDAGADGLWLTEDDKTSTLLNIVVQNDVEIMTIVGTPHQTWQYLLDEIINPPSLRGLFSKAQANWMAPAGGRGRLSYRTGSPTDIFDSSYYWHEASYETHRFVRKKTNSGFEIRSTYAKGPDHLWDTEDDVVDGIWTVVNTGLIYVISEFVSPGVDNVWKTADDRLAFAAYLEFDGNGLIVKEKQILSSGVDKIMFTDDDSYIINIERSQLLVGSKTYVYMRARSINEFKFEQGGVRFDNLGARDNTDVYVMDNTFFPTKWRGPTAVYHAVHFEFSTAIDHYSLTSESSDSTGAGSVIQLNKGSGYCQPKNRLLLDGCVSASDTKDAASSVLGTIKFPGDNQLVFGGMAAGNNYYPDGLDNVYVHIDRTGN